MLTISIDISGVEIGYIPTFILITGYADDLAKLVREDNLNMLTTHQLPNVKD